MEAIAKYDFKATADDELSFKRGDILKVSADAQQPSVCSPAFFALVTQRSCACPCFVAHFNVTFLGALGSWSPGGISNMT